MTKISEEYPGKELSTDKLKEKLVAETKVTKTANEMTDIIWKKNYRRIKR